MDALDIPIAAIYGASGGGPLTYAFAAKYPERVWAVLGECTVSQYYNLYANAVSRMFADIFLSNYGSYWLTNLAKKNPNAAIRAVVSGGSKLKGKALKEELSLLYKDPVMLEITRELISSMSPMNNRKAGMNKDVEICRAIKSLNLEAIKAPSLIMHGLMDHDVDFAHAENAHNRIKGSELITFPKAGHVIPLSSNYHEYVTKKQAFFEKYRP
jgi:pimeloyl-ACP methyl ester carboxylesterase